MRGMGVVYMHTCKKVKPVQVNIFLFCVLLGSDVNKPDRHGKTPLHLAHSRLRILRMKSGDDAVQTTLDRKRETENVSRMRFLVRYFCRACYNVGELCAFLSLKFLAIGYFSPCFSFVSQDMINPLHMHMY